MGMRSALIYFITMLYCIDNSEGRTTIRLVGGNRTQGRLEVYHNNQWGTVCDDSFDSNSASVVCRMLKLSWYGTVGKFGVGTDPILLDDVTCIGNEFDISDCRHNNWGIHNCGHGEDVGVICNEDRNYFRFKSWSKGSEGVFEIYSPKIHEWISLCSDGFDNSDAQVICRSLNFSPSGATVVSTVNIGRPSNKMINQQFNCNGNEQQLIKCDTTEKKICTSHSTPLIACSNSDIRMVNGNSSNEGKVEIKHNGQWGDICDTGIDTTDAKVFCRMLGYDNVREAEMFKYNGSGNSQKHLENVNCYGNERDINRCSNVQWGSSCYRGTSLGLKCYSTNVRLRGGHSPYEGRLEVYHNGIWGTVCDNSFDNTDALVVCNMLGANVSSAIKYAGAYFGEGNGAILMDNVDCTGKEKDIAGCSFSGRGNHNCRHSKDVSVKCNKPFEIRLQNGYYNQFEGRVEIKMNGQWGSTSYIHFTPYMADEFCRYLGYNESINVYDSSKFGQMSSYYPIWQLQHLFGNTYPYAKTYKNHQDDVGITCLRTKVRLTGGTTLSQGRVEVFHNGQWGSVCCGGFTSNSAQVICKQLGFIGSATWNSNSRYGRTNGKPMWINNLKCSGKESDISSCTSDEWQSASCNEYCNIGVTCEKTNIRLVNGSAPFQGRVELYHNSEWGTVASTNDIGGRTMCRMMGYNESDVSLNMFANNAQFGKGSVELLPSTYCPNDMMDIAGCVKRSKVNWTRNSYPSNNANIRCLLTIRLVDGPSPSIGRVEIRRNNVWGTLCGAGMTDQLASEICKMVAPSPYTWHMTGKVMTKAFYGKGSGATWKLKDGCNNDIAKCLLSEDSHTDCSHSDDVGVFCTPNMDTRLTGGHHEGEGRVELRYNNEWIGVCDVSWDINDASTVCRAIGYWKNSATSRFDSWFGQTTNQLWYLYPNCGTNEINLGLCSVQDGYYYGYTHCSQSDEAGVSCVSTNLGKDHIKLMNTAIPWKGELQVEISPNRWGGVCWQWWNDSISDVICRTLQYKSYGNSYTSYQIENATSLFMSRFNCNGSESDIGMCKGFYDTYNCAKESVGIDCSGGIEIRLQNGSNPLEGRVEVKLNGEWKTLCDSNWDINDAKGICTSVGIRDSTPDVLSNAYFGEGNSSKSISELGCSGWEDHIGQCNIQDSGSCSHSQDAGIRCVDCYEEHNATRGQILSRNYPSYISNNNDCVYVIKPDGSNTTQYLLQINEFRNGYPRDIQVREGFQGPLISHITQYQPNSQIIGKEFYIRYTQKSYSDRYKITWRPVEISDAINVKCDSSHWNIKVNMTVLKAIYPDTIKELIFFPDTKCKGIWKEDSIYFNQKYTECQTQRQDLTGTIYYKNTLKYPESKIPNPVIIRNFRWTIDVDCELGKVNSGNINFHPDETYSTTDRNHQLVEPVTGHLSGTGKETITIEFYKDSKFLEQLKGSPVHIHIGETVYVKVISDADSNYKMRLHSCIAKPLSYSSIQDTYPLIKDGCTLDSTTQIISQTKEETRFSFNVFEFQSRHDNVYVECNATFCLYNQNSAECNQVCHSKRSLIVTSGEDFRGIGRSSLFMVNPSRRERRSIHVPSKHKDAGVSLLVPFVGISVFVFSIIVTANVIFMKQNRIKLIKK